MTFTIAVISVSIVKSILVALALIGWAKLAAVLDKDAEYYYLKRQSLNAMMVGAGALAFLAWLLIPIFWLGMLLAILIIAGAFFTYAKIHNSNVPDNARWDFSTDFISQVLLQRQQSRATREATIRFISAASKSSAQFKDVPLPDQPHYEPYLAAEDVLVPAIARGAQRLDIGVSQKDVVISQQIDGVAYRQEAMEPQKALDMIDLLKAEAGLDIEEKRRKQTGAFKVNTQEHGNHEIRITTAGSTRGITAVLEIDPHEQMLISYEQLGLMPAQQEQLKPILESSEGVVLVAAPPDQGRSVTLHALLQEHDPYMMDVHLMEDEQEVSIEGVTQHEVTDSNWAKPLNSILLRDPAVVGVGSLQDADTAKLAADAALDGRRLYLGVRADDTFTALRMYAKAVGDLDKVAKSLSAATAQRLVRTLCPECKQAYKPDAAALKKMNLPANRVNELYKASGKVMVDNDEEPCPKCHGIGYIGRTAVFEVLVIDDEARELIRKSDLNGLRSHLRRQKMLYLQETALAKVVAGQTSIREAMRVLDQDKKQAQPAG